MKLTPPPPALNFLAGLVAGAGINMLTSVATAPGETSTMAIVVDAAVWVLAAASATWLAHVVDEVNREVDRRVHEDFRAREEAGVRRDVHRAATAATLVAAAAGVLLLPNLMPVT